MQPKKTNSIDKLKTSIYLIRNKQKNKNKILKHSVLLVRKWLDGTIREGFNDYLNKFSHQLTTRNDRISLQIPVKLKYAKSGFF